ncbi:STAS domain-containing protein [Subtercola sp. PAMC28395]|uniref:STAS domain-containing protein n=1 Tax=Subtercola sp. PAMC28395 TaxID=2846775 RepID=UPI001C0D041D|nr:STAS domain-containing protein [Subtercola sp. PAMC28395]QWT24314.1 STAS domain-containing protein [Subtercola sp. PAMC28395]
MIIRTESGPNQNRVSLVGRFDAHEAESFRRTVAPLLTAETSTLRLDLSQVAFVDSTALTELVRLQKSAKALSGELILVDLSDPVRVILEITDLRQVFSVEQSGASSS